MNLPFTLDEKTDSIFVGEFKNGAYIKINLYSKNEFSSTTVIESSRSLTRNLSVIIKEHLVPPGNEFSLTVIKEIQSVIPGEYWPNYFYLTWGNKIMGRTEKQICLVFYIKE